MSSSTQPALVLAKRLDDCWEKYRTELKRTQREFANEYVHDLRVSIRRLIAAIEMGRAVVHGKGLKRSRRLLKSQLDAFDALRDTQVQITIVEELQEHLPEIIPYRDHLRKREQNLVSRLKKKDQGFSLGRAGATGFQAAQSAAGAGPAGRRIAHLVVGG